MHLLQPDYDIRCEWGLKGVEHLAPDSDAVVIVDVLSFSTCVDIAVSRGAAIYPFRSGDGTAQQYARRIGAILADSVRTVQGYTLSPASLLAIPTGTLLVLPSPNGSALSTATGAIPTFAGCLRNAMSVARACAGIGSRISVIPAGERWPDGGLRPAIEDLIGAGAIISFLQEGRTLSPEAEIALAAFRAAKPDLPGYLQRCVSGQELIERGFPRDIALAAELNISDAAPALSEEAFAHFTH